MKQNYANQEIIPLNIAGGTKFGRYPKISIEQTYNMMISDGWLVSFPAYSKVLFNNPNGVGRRIFTSTRWGRMIAVVDNKVYAIASNLSVQALDFTLNTNSGDVFIDENNNYQIAICDQENIWIYNWQTGVAINTTLDFLPGYITYHDTYFISVDASVYQGQTAPLGNSTWRLSDSGNGLTWPDEFTGAIQTKPDYAKAVVRIPGRGNQIFLQGNNVTEQWYDVGAPIFPYQKSTTANIDYGLVNPSTIAETDNLVAWLGQNEKSGLAILFSTGGEVQQISTDGINFKLGEVNVPTSSYGFCFKQYGHVFYVISFYDPSDNFSYAYDFLEDKFYTLTDEHFNVYIVKNICFFNNTYYFVSIRDGNIYELDGRFTTYNYGNGLEFEVPCVRICPNIRYPDASYFSINNITFTVEQGTDLSAKSQPVFVLGSEDSHFYIATQNNQLIGTESVLNYEAQQGQPAIDLALSKNGGMSFGSYERKTLNPVGDYKNRLVWWQGGAANDVVCKFRFVSFGRKVAADGEVIIYR